MRAAQVFQARRLASAIYLEKQEIFETLGAARAEAARILEAAQAGAEAQRAALQIELETHREEAMADAEETAAQFLKDEKEQRMSEALAGLFAFSLELQTDFEGSEDWLTHLVIEAVRRVLSGMSADDLDRELIRSAIKECGARWKLELQVAQDQQERIERLLRLAGSGFGCIESIVANPQLRPGQMLLVSASGVTDLSVEVQLATLADVVRAACLEGKGA